MAAGKCTVTRHEAEIFEPAGYGRYAAPNNRLEEKNEDAVVEPIGLPEQRRVVAATEHYVLRAGAIYGRRFREVPVLFDLGGRTAGMF
ncbi:MAG: hypothetical protein KA137_01660, partial [Halioglobus sp.]|nr:hypothetical protein [Halioglobus sp.]